MKKGIWRMMAALLFCLSFFALIGDGTAWAGEAVPGDGRAEGTELEEMHSLVLVGRKEATCAE